MGLRVETSVLVLFARKVWISANFARTTEFGCLESAWSKEQTKDSEETKKTNRAVSTLTYRIRNAEVKLTQKKKTIDHRIFIGIWTQIL